MALAVTCCWSGDLIHLQRLIRAVPEGSAEAAVAREEPPVLFTRPEAPPGTTAPPCELFITLPSGFELHSCVVASTARTMELYAAPASSAVSALEYCGSSGRGKAVGDTGVYECLVTRQRDTVPGAAVLRLRLVSLSDPSEVLLHSVALHMQGVSKVAPSKAPSTANAAGNSLPPQLRALLSGMAVSNGAVSTSKKGGNNNKEHKDSEEHHDAAIGALKCAMEARMTAMEQRMEALCVDVERRLRRLEDEIYGPSELLKKERKTST